MKTKNSGFGLKNNGDLEIFFIGTGSAFASTLNQTSFLIVKGNTHIAVDFGMTAPKALEKSTGLKPTDIEIIFPTHSHADHVGGLECLALMNRYISQQFMNKEKIKIIISQEYQRILWDYTLRGGLEWNEESIKTKKPLGFNDYFDIIRPKWKTHQPREIFELKVGDINLEIFRTKHIPETSLTWEDSFLSYGLYIDNKVLISGDTRFDKELFYLYGHRSEVIFHDVQFFHGAVHASLKELKTLSSKLKRKIYLMHYSDDWINQNIADFAGWAQSGTRYIFN